VYTLAPQYKDDVRADISRPSPKAGGVISQMARGSGGLEDAFMSLVGKRLADGEAEKDDLAHRISGLISTTSFFGTLGRRNCWTLHPRIRYRYS